MLEAHTPKSSIGTFTEIGNFGHKVRALAIFIDLGRKAFPECHRWPFLLQDIFSIV